MIKTSGSIKLDTKVVRSILKKREEWREQYRAVSHILQLNKVIHVPSQAPNPHTFPNKIGKYKPPVPMVLCGEFFKTLQDNPWGIPIR